MIQPELLVSMSAVDGVLPIIAAGDNPGKRECQQGEDTAEFEHLTSFQNLHLNSWLESIANTGWTATTVSGSSQGRA